MSLEPGSASEPFYLDMDYLPDNGTDDEDDGPCSMQGVRYFSTRFLPVAYSLICVSGLLGNVLVVVTFAFYKKAKSMTDVYLLNMAVADVLFVLTLPFWAASHARGGWAFSGALCKLTTGVYAVNFHCGMLLLACISLDRYVAIVQATRSFLVRARMLAHRRAICAAVWAVSVLASSGTFLFYEKYEEQNSTVCGQQLGGVADPVRWKRLALALQLVFGFAPLACMALCYALIVRALVRAQNAKRHRAIRVIIAVVLVFLACQLPHNVALLVWAARLGSPGRSCGSERLATYARTVTEALAFLHCCLNPVLYAFVGQRFRNYFLKVAKDLCCRGRRPRALALPCGRPPSDTLASRQNSETADNENVSSFTM